MRVQIPAYTDRWMMGDRYGEVIKVTHHRPANAVRAAILSGERWPKAAREVAHVKLDKSGKIVRVIFADCEAIG